VPAPVTGVRPEALPAGHALGVPAVREGRWAQVRLARRNALALAGAAVVAAWVAAAVAAPWVAPYSPLQQNLRERLRPPDTRHVMGTDELGRDIFSRVIYGSRISLPVGLVVVTSSTAIGTALGSVAGYWGGLLDAVLMRLTDLVMAFPPIILAMAVAAALGPGIHHAALALVVVAWPAYARVIRGLVLSVKSQEYVLAARALGAGEGRILLRTVLPNCLGPAVVMATLDLGRAILIFSGLSFLGLGAVSPAPEWGAMVAGGINAFDQWWVSGFPGLAILSVVLAFNFLGDGLRDALDPRLRRAP
jgi:peptide/nickel transport system permease protein